LACLDSSYSRSEKPIEKESICLFSLANRAITDESRPPLRNIPTGTSEMSCLLTATFSIPSKVSLRLVILPLSPLSKQMFGDQYLTCSDTLPLCQTTYDPGDSFLIPRIIVCG